MGFYGSWFLGVRKHRIMMACKRQWLRRLGVIDCCKMIVTVAAGTPFRMRDYEECLCGGIVGSR